MTQEEKQLLLKDLCTRIPYRTFVCLNPGAYNKPETCILTGVDEEQVYLNVDSDPFRVDHIKPYLRPMSSMTKEEEYIYLKLRAHALPFAIVEWLDKNHFDHRTNKDGETLIETGRKPCTDCPYNEKIHFKDQYGRRIIWQNCMAGKERYWPNIKVHLGYYEMIANCVDYAEYLAWQREHRKHKMKKI